MSAPLIFISYAREDGRTARQVYANLVRSGFRPWLDREHLDPGSQWEVEIPKAIKSSDVFLALVSSKSLNKNGYVQREIQLALAVLDELPLGQTFVIPARLDDCRPEDERLREGTWVDLFPSFSDGMRSITAAVRKHAAPAPTCADERLAMLQVKLEAFWRDGGKRVLNSVLAQARIRELMAPDMMDELKVRVAWLFRGHFSTLTPPPVSFAWFSSDGALVVAEYANGVNLVWDVETGVLRTIAGPFLTNRFQNAACTRLLQPLERDGLIHSMVTDRGKPVRLVGHTAPIRVCAFSDDAARIVTGAQDGTARLWDATTGDPLMVMRGHPDWATAVALSPDGEHAVTASGAIGAKEYGDQRVRLWDLRTKRLKALLRGHPPGPGLWDLAFSPSGDRLVSASLDGSVCLWDCDYWAKVADMRFHNTLVQSARFSPNGSKVVTASADGHVVVWPAFSRIEALDEVAGQLRNP